MFAETRTRRKYDRNKKFDRHLKAKAHAVGDAVWVVCHIIPKGGTRKLLRAWRGPHKVTDMLQDGRLYVLDTGQKAILSD